MAAKKTTVLVVLDGWGIGANNESNPIYVVKPPTFEYLAQNYPLTSLQASGIAVGLPWGEVGNSEVGHLTLGAGKVLYQYFPKITMAIRDGSFMQNPVLIQSFDHVKKNNSAINFAGLLTKANVHASIDHLKALIAMAETAGIKNINLHLFADGKDSPPKSLEGFLKEIPREYMASLVGRYYAMDRNGNWRLTQTAYQTMTQELGPLVNDPTPLIEANYKQGLTEEYLAPIRFSDAKRIKDGDALIFFNYREDSIRQIATSFIMKPFQEFPTVPFNDLFIATMTHYEDSLKAPVLFEADRVTIPFGKVISDKGLAQLRIAETYKYAHVTYFFNGLVEPPFPGEYRTLVPTDSSLHPQEHPEMMAKAITDRLIEAIHSKGFSFILVNYANADAIAHTADYNASLEAVRIIDREIDRVIKAIGDDPEVLLAITADHGNIEEMLSLTTGLPESQHDASPVPLHLIAPELKGRKFVGAEHLATQSAGSLADVAPTLLALMGIEKPAEMTGTSLLEELL